MPHHKFYCGDVLDILRKIESESVHCVVTSPPYWRLRNYGVDGQIGLEKTPEEYVDKLVQVFREVRRVLRDDGTLWLNLGDCYNGAGHGSDDKAGVKGWDGSAPTISCSSLKPKDLVGIPWRVAFALQKDGWYLRSDIIWAKPNPMPESVKDRPTRAHEYIFLLSKSKSYYYDQEAIREPHKPESLKRYKYGLYGVYGDARKYGGKQSHNLCNCTRMGNFVNYAGRNKRTVWWIATEPFPEAHFATFPTALVEPCIKAGTSEKGCCPKCGAPWERVTEHCYEKPRGNSKIGGQKGTDSSNHWGGYPVLNKISTTIGWHPTCSCGIEKTVPCVVLDPFGGAGTTSFVAKRLNRSSIYIDIKPEYLKMAIKRMQFQQQGIFERHTYEVVS